MPSPRLSNTRRLCTRALGIGLASDAKVTKARRFASAKPVVFYGTSITQGGCASRSGLSYQAILARQLNLDFVNLGFSGNGKGESVVARMVAEIDASAFVLDFSQNNPTVESLREVRTLSDHASHKTPEHADYRDYRNCFVPGKCSTGMAVPSTMERIPKRTAWRTR